MMEWWNIGKYQLTHHPKPIIPTLQYSIIPIAERSGAKFDPINFAFFILQFAFCIILSIISLD